MPAPTPPQKAQNRYYFDRTFLLKYINQKVKTKVFVDGRFLDVADASDLEDELHGVGYDNNGNPKFFDYRSIEQIKAGSNLLTLDQLQQVQNQQQQSKGEPEGEEEPEESETPEEEPSDVGEEEPAPTAGESPEGSDEEEPESPEEEPKTPTGGKQPQKAHYDPYSIGRMIINESMKKKRPNEVNKMVRILERPYYNVTGVITEVRDTTYEIRPLSGYSGRIEIPKNKVKFL
jgi:hypothetical protein